MPDLSLKRLRDPLKKRRNPYWMRLDEGAYLGFRRGPDTWHARYRGRDKVQNQQALKDATDYDSAKKLAEDWFQQLGAPAVRKVKRDTVRAALEAYLADLRRHKRHGTAKEAEGRFKTVVYNDRIDPNVEGGIADVALESATQDDFLEWRDRISEGREPRTVNRHVRAVAAGLNKARKKLGYVGNAEAWMLERLSDDVEDEGETAIFLDPKQRRGIIAAASARAADFLRGLDFTGARPGELANAKVGDFDGESVRLVHRKGKPPKPRVRHTVLNEDGVEFFKTQARGKLPGAPLFTEDGSQSWRRHIWAREVRKAITVHNEKKDIRPEVRVPPGASAYSFRHARISELLQIHEVDAITVAAQTGTSVAVIEKFYYKFIPSAMRAKLAALKSA